MDECRKNAIRNFLSDNQKLLKILDKDNLSTGSLSCLKNVKLWKKKNLRKKFFEGVKTFCSFLYLASMKF